jgi:hypothetical protein
MDRKVECVEGTENGSIIKGKLYKVVDTTTHYLYIHNEFGKTHPYKHSRFRDWNRNERLERIFKSIDTLDD